MSPYSVPVCPWCGMPSRMHPDTHREWMTAHMNCGSEIYPPGATTPSHQSDACKVIASTAADRDAIRAELERTKEDLGRVRRNHLRRMYREALDWADRMIWDIPDEWAMRNRPRLLDLASSIRAALERKDGA